MNTIITFFGIIIGTLLIFLGQMFSNTVYVGGDESKAEKVVRAEFEDIVRGYKFPTVRPSWLKRHGRILELDGYNQELELAFEYQGPHHTRYDTRYQKKYSGYIETVIRDKLKIIGCAEHGTELIVIDYRVPRRLVGIYIRSRLYDIFKKNGKFPQFGREMPDYMSVVKAKPIRILNFDKTLTPELLEELNSLNLEFDIV
jgi:hypothetical protein